MSSDDEALRVALEELTAEFGVEITESDADEILEAIGDIEFDESRSNSFDIQRQLQCASVGVSGDDDYGAFLDRYEHPRHRAESGALTDVEIGIKDVIAVEGLELTCGSATFSCVPLTDAAVVDRLLDDGASIVGKTNTDAFAFGPTGEFSELKTVTNPVAPDRVPGGSSSGSAAAVAGGLLDVALGTDTGGSVRIPAACCGIVGVKPTHSLVPRFGLVDLAPSLDTIGPLAPDVTTGARVLDVIAGADPRDPTTSGISAEPIVENDSIDDGSDTDDLSVGVPTQFFDRTDDAVTDVIHTVLDDLESLESVSTVAAVDLPVSNVERAFPHVIGTEFAWVLRQSGLIRGGATTYSDEWRQIGSMVADSLTAHIAKRMLPATLLDCTTAGRSYVQAQEVTATFSERLRSIFDHYDVLIVPTLRTLPPKRGAITATDGVSDMTGNTSPFNLSGHPAVAVPVGDVDGIPVSAQVIAPRFEDRTALVAASRIERLLE